MQGALVASTGGNHSLFVVFVVLHVVAAVAGFGAIAFSGVYAGTAQHLDKPGAAAEARRFFSSPNWAALSVLAVPFFGAAALAAGGRSGQFGHAWVVGALAVWLAAAGLYTAVVRPGEQRLAVLLAPEGSVVPEAPVVREGSAVPEGHVVLEGHVAAAVAAVARRVSLAAAACDVGFVLALGLMIWQP